MDNEQLIQDYIANRLSESERDTFERRLETDGDFVSEFESHQDLTIAFKISEAQKLKTHFEQLERSLTQPRSIFSKFKYVYLAIASIVIIGFFYNLFNTESGEELFNSNFEIYPNTYQPITRSSNTSDNNNNAFLAYENGNFVVSEKEFKSILKNSENHNIRFYYALSLLNQSKFDLALKQFETLKVNSYDYSEESLWFTALIHVKKEDNDKAKDKLNQLNTLNSKFKSKERKLLLQKLNNK